MGPFIGSFFYAKITLVINHIMIKQIIAAGAVFASTAAIAAPNVVLTRGDAFAIRSCPINGEYVGLCYNQAYNLSGTRRTADQLVNVSTERVVELNCERRHSAKTERGKLAAEFCPQVLDGTLAPAAFLP